MSTKMREEPAAPAVAGPMAKEGRVTVRAIVIAILLSIVSALWVRQAEIVVVAAQVSESVPPIPALAALILTLGLNPLLRAFGPRFGLSRQEQIVIYCFVMIASAMCGPGAIRFLLVFLVTPFHYATPVNAIANLQHFIPSWLAVSDPQAVQDLFRGSHTGVPWRVWLMPLASWTAFLMAFWMAMLCLMLLVRHRWVETEQLTFPLIKLPLEMTDETDASGIPAFFRNRVMWIGFGIAAAYNLVNILHALIPTIPALGTSIDLTPMLSIAPWSSLGPLRLQFQPELVGLGYLVPTEICFSIWFFYLMSRCEAFFAFTHGWYSGEVPYEQQQSIGAFLVLGLWFLWQIRRDLFLPPRVGARFGAPRWPLIGLVASFLFLGWFLVHAGMAPWVTVAYLAILLLTALATARIRADAGAPLIWLFPFFQQKMVMLDFLGTAPFASSSMPGTFTIFTILTFLSRGYYPAFIGAQIDSLKMAREVRVGHRQMAGVIVLAAFVGILLAFWIHLTVYYHRGAENLGGGLWGLDMAVPEYTAVHTSLPPNHARMNATLFGAALTIVLLVARSAIVGFPLHPFGYAMATAYGSFVWSSFLFVWIVKASLLRWGGVEIYRKAIPLFLGFTLGHFFVAGIVWGLIGACWPDVSRAYYISFG